MRLKTRITQLTAEPVKDLEIDWQEAEYVKVIFNKTLNEG